MYRWTCGHTRNEADPAGPCPTCKPEAAREALDRRDVLNRLRQTQCCDPVIDGLIAAAIEEISRLNLLAMEMAVKRDLSLAENRELRKAVRNQAGDNLCWLTIGENHPDVKIPPREEFLKSCERFHAQIAGENGVLTGCKTISQLEAEVAELREKLSRT